MVRRLVTGTVCLLCVFPPAFAQLDPARTPLLLQKPPTTLLREQFIWTRGDAAALDPTQQARVRGQDDKVAPHFFRANFTLQTVPAQATLYLAGPRSAKVYLNGTPVLQFTDDGKREKGFNVSMTDVASALRPGRNVIAIEEVRGHSSLHTGASPTINQVTYGEVLLAKIVPRSAGVDATPIVATDSTWRSTLSPGQRWTTAEFDDSQWAPVQALGVPGTKSDFLQWNADAGLYAWPGYVGIGAAMRTFRLPVAAVQVLSGTAHPESLLHGGALAISPASEPSTLMLDFGRELNGRVRLVSSSDKAVKVEASYGESREEAAAQPYLGVRTILAAAHAEALGPKSGFRYVQLRFPAAGSRWSRIDVEGITYPVSYAGSFTSSDPLVNRIWETAAYTAHLCMQEGIWDAPKRDRGRWMGDLDVTGRTINSVFADRALMEETMSQIIGDSPVRRDVNTIAGYSALWITGQADFYRSLGDLAYLQTIHNRLLELLAVMDTELNAEALFTNPGGHKIFVDWSPGFNTDTPDARAATHLEFFLAYKQAAYLLSELNDTAHAESYRTKAASLLTAAQDHLLDTNTGTYGNRWQTNAMAVVSGAATTSSREAIWQSVLSRINDPASTDVVTPYYGFYVLTAMANLDHRADALRWMRQYWGGMLNEGATSFWEAYDPHWPTQDFHASLQADNKEGYYVSLAHGWSSGPAAWLIEQVLGIVPTARGFAQVTIRPDLAGLNWARGARPTPRGLLRVDASQTSIKITLPPATVATLLLPFAPGSGVILDNGHQVHTTPDETGSRSMLLLRTPGQHIFTIRKDSTQ
jgi:alpha-L-rhamnosidase